MASQFKPNKAFAFTITVPNDRFAKVWKIATESGEMLSANFATGTSPSTSTYSSAAMIAAANANSAAASALAIGGKTEGLPTARINEVRGNFTFSSVEGAMTTLAATMEDQDRAALFKLFWAGEGDA